MPLIYVKLGSVTEYKDERLNLSLSDPDNIAAALDYLNLNEDVIKALNTGVIVQITEAEYYGVISTNVEPISVPTSYLPTLSKYLTYKFNDNAIFFAYYNNQWYKVLWSEIAKHFSGNAFRVAFRVGDPTLVPGAGENYPADGESSFILNVLKDKDWENITVTLNGSEIYNYNLHTPENQTSLDNWNIDPDTGEFSKLVPFNTDDIITITGK
jgi:hypothetical protein